MNIYKKYVDDVVKIGRLTMILGMIAVLLPPFIMTFIFGFNPGITAIIAGAISQISVSGAFYFSEPISYYPIIGTTGLYIEILSGNAVNMRIPAAVTSIEASGYKSGTDEGSLMGTIGIAVSVYVGIFFVLAATFLGQTLIANLPAEVSRMLTLIIPALYGGIFGQFAVKSYKTALFAITIAFIMTKVVGFLPGNMSFLITLVSVFSTIAVAKTQLETINKNN